jgi:hypothetical protein
MMATEVAIRFQNSVPAAWLVAAFAVVHLRKSNNKRFPALYPHNNRGRQPYHSFGRGQPRRLLCVGNNAPISTLQLLSLGVIEIRRRGTR